MFIKLVLLQLGELISSKPPLLDVRYLTIDTMIVIIVVLSIVLIDWLLFESCKVTLVNAKLSI